MKELKQTLARAQKAMAELLAYFPDETIDEPALDKVIQAALALDKLEDHLKKLWGKEWGK